MGWDDPVDKSPLAREVAPHRGRKDTRRWCGGKVGREHRPIIELDKGTQSMRQARPDAGKCAYVRRWLISKGERLEWSCNHVEVCARCRKVLVRPWEMDPQLCPEWYDKGPEPDLCVCGHALSEHSRSWRGECTTCECSQFRWIKDVAS